MAIDHASAAQAIRRLALQLQGMSTAADILEMIGPPEQALAEVNAKLDVARTELAEVTTEHENKIASIAQVQANADELLRAANAEANDIRLKAEQDAQSVRDAAQADADSITAQAKTDASCVLQQSLADARTTLANLGQSIRDAQQSANDAIALRDTAQQALDNINQQIASAKARVQAAFNT